MVRKAKATASILTGCRCGHEEDDHGPFDDAAPRDPNAYSPLDDAPDGTLSWCTAEDCRRCPGMTPQQLGYSRCQRKGGLEADPDTEGLCGAWERDDEPCGEHHTSCACCGGWADECKCVALGHTTPCWFRGCEVCYGNGFTWENKPGPNGRPIGPSVKVPCSAKPCLGENRRLPHYGKRQGPRKIKEEPR